MLSLRFDTPEAWKAIAMADLDLFLQDHANNERKVCQSAMALVAQHPKKDELVDLLIPIAEEEMLHFRQVYQILRERGVMLALDAPDPYMGKLFRAIRRKGSDEFLLDRLVLFGIVEARGCERFRMVFEALEPGDLKDFYAELVRSEARHHAVYLQLARRYFDADVVKERLDMLLDREAEIVKNLPLRPALH